MSKEQINVLGYHLNLDKAQQPIDLPDHDVVMVSDSIKDQLADEGDMLRLQIEEQNKKRYMVLVEPKDAIVLSGVLTTMDYDFQARRTSIGLRLMTQDAMTYFISSNVEHASAQMRGKNQRTVNMRVMRDDKDIVVFAEKKLCELSIRSIDHENEMCEILMRFQDSYA